MTCEATHSATFSPALVGGVTPSGSQDGPMLDLFGQEVAPASRSAPRASSVAATMSATYGLRSSASSESAAVQTSLASRLPDLLDTHGGITWQQTWKTKVTPLRRRILAHTASVLLTSDNGCIGLPTPTAAQQNVRGATAGARPRGNGKCLFDAAGLAAWPTPNAGPQNDGDTTWQQRREAMKAKHGNGNGFGLTLGQSSTLASWPSPTSSDTTGASHAAQGGVNLRTAATWATPTRSDHQGAATPKAVKRWGSRGYNLPEQGQMSAWATPQSRDHKGAMNPGNELTHNTRPLNELARLVVHGPTLNGSSAATAKPGQLNPAFPRWLMGYPPEWDACAGTGTPLCRRSPRNSSKQA